MVRKRGRGGPCVAVGVKERGFDEGGTVARTDAVAAWECSEEWGWLRT
jgi:hypothetical protein